MIGAVQGAGAYAACVSAASGNGWGRGEAVASSLKATGRPRVTAGAASDVTVELALARHQFSPASTPGVKEANNTTKPPAAARRMGVPSVTRRPRSRAGARIQHVKSAAVSSV